MVVSWYGASDPHAYHISPLDPTWPARMSTRQPTRDDASLLLPTSYEGLRTLQEQFRRYQDTAFPHRPPRFFSLELAGETGELANLEKKVWKGRTIDDADFRDEAADVCIALLNYANSRRIDLSRAVAEKMSRIDATRVAEPETAGRSGDT